MKEYERLQATGLEVLKDLEEIDVLHEMAGFDTELNHFRRRLADDEFRIAVVGEFSSGKSTFINALLGRDLLLHATEETTAVITRIVNVSPDDPRAGTGRVQFRDGSYKAMKSLNELREYTTTFSHEYSVAEQMEQAEIYYPIMKDSRDVVIVDTPGLNGTADGHREQTIDLVQQAHACIYLLQRRGLAESDVFFVRELSEYQKHFIFVQNFIDDLKRVEGETAASKIAEQRTILDEQIFSDSTAGSYRLCAVSALQELASRDQTLTSLYADSESLTDQDRQRLAQKSNFDELRQILADEFELDKQSQIKFQDTLYAISEWAQQLSERLKSRYQRAQDVYDGSREAWSDAKLAAMHKKVVDSREPNIRNLKRFVSSCEYDLEKKEKHNLERSVEEILQRVRSELDSVHEPKQLDRKIKDLESGLLLWVKEASDASAIRMGNELQRIAQLLTSRIEEYSGVSADVTLDLDCSLSIPKQGMENGLLTLDGIEKAKKNLEQTQRVLGESQEDQRRIGSKIGQQSEKKEQASKKVERIEKSHKDRVQHLGKRPQAQHKTREYVTKEDRSGFFGKVWQVFAGKKKVKHKEEYVDDSRGKAWDAEYARIQQQYQRDIKQARSDLAAWKRRLADLETDRQANKKRIEILQSKVSQDERRLKDAKERHELELKVAQDEYVRTARASVLQQIEEYLLGETGALVQLRQWMQDGLHEVENRLSQEATKGYDQAVAQRLRSLEAVRAKQPSELKDEILSIGRQLDKMYEVQRKLILEDSIA